MERREPAYLLYIFSCPKQLAGWKPIKVEFFFYNKMQIFLHKKIRTNVFIENINISISETIAGKRRNFFL